MKLQKIKQWTAVHRRAVFLYGSLGLIVITLISYVLWSYVTWSDYTLRYESRIKEISAQIETVLSSKSVDQVALLKKASTDIASKKSGMCERHALVDWQGAILPNIRRQHEACERMLAHVDTIEVKMDNVVKYLNNKDVIAKILANSRLHPDQLTESDFEQQVALWQATTSGISKVATEASFVPIKQKAVERTQAILQAWQQAVSAHTAKDKSKFSEALALLATAYSGIFIIEEVNNKQYQYLFNDLQAAYKKL